MGKAGQRIQDMNQQMVGQTKPEYDSGSSNPTMNPCSNGTGSGRPNFSPPQGMMGMMGGMNQGMQGMMENFRNRATQARQQMPYERQGMFGMSMEKPKMGASVEIDAKKAAMAVGGIALAGKLLSSTPGNKAIKDTDK